MSKYVACTKCSHRHWNSQQAPTHLHVGDYCPKRGRRLDETDMYDSLEEAKRAESFQPTSLTGVRPALGKE